MHFSTIGAFAVLSGITAIVKVNAGYCGNTLGWCLDDTEGTPCCGYGECNMFCYNCDGGCRTENLAGCINIAAQVEDLCIEDIDCDGNAAECTSLGLQCGSAYKSDVSNCQKNYSSRRSLYDPEDSAELEDRAVKDNQTAFDIATMFQIVDIDKDNKLDLSEYLRLINITTNGSLHGPMTTSKWVNYFITFDKDGDGKVSLEEASAKQAR